MEGIELLGLQLLKDLKMKVSFSLHTYFYPICFLILAFNFGAS